MQISKSLFVDYKEFPKLAWWKQNNTDTYKWIKWIEDDEASDQLIELWQKVEDLVWEYFFKKEWLTKLNVFEDNTAKNPFDEEDEDMLLISDDYKVKRDRNLIQTIEAIKNKEPLIYQPWFMIEWLFIRGDYLKLNSSWKYQLIEVKAKTKVRNINKTKCNLQNQFLSDISFQKYVINKVLAENWLDQIEDFSYAYLNKNYKKSWDINISQIIIIDIVNTVKLIGNSEWEMIKVDDTLLTSGVIEWNIKSLKEDLSLNEEEFNKIHTFSWSKALEYFWKERKFWTIFWKGLTSPKAVRELYYKWKISLESLDIEEQELFNTAKWIWSARNYIINYLKAQTNWDYISSEEIKNELDNIKYPICFYDYESCSVPIPFLDNTSPYQHSVVQYSLHKVYEDWKIEHFWWVLAWTGEKKVTKIEIPNNPNKVDFESEKVITWWYDDVLWEFIKDIWEDLDKTFIVWYKGFENSRNDEIAETFPHLTTAFETINENTYDLMDIFKKWYYYSLKFKGSNSIKYVLPAMVPSMSYDNMAVPNWLEAMQVLNDVINTDKYNSQEKEEQIKNLLLYCGQDSLAMYKIYEEVLKKLD